MFTGEYLYRLWKADDRREYLRHHWYDLPGLAPLFVEALPWFQEAGALRFLRVIRILRLLRALPAVRRLYRRTRFLQRVIAESHLARLLSLVAILIALTSVGFWIVEPRTTVHDFDDAVWCAVGTFTTAGFVEPQTGAGRIIATVVMLLGMATGTAVATALVTTTLRLREEERPARTLENLEALRAAGVLTAEQFQTAHSRLLVAALEGLHADGLLSEVEFAAGRDRVLWVEQKATAPAEGGHA